MTASKGFSESFGNGVFPGLSKSLEEVSASLELMTASKGFSESFGNGVFPGLSKSLEEVSASLELMTASKAFTESLSSGIIPGLSRSFEDALSKQVSQPFPLMLGEKFSQSLAPLVDSQSRMSEMIAQSLAVPELGFVMSQNNALIASAIEDIQAVYSTPGIRIQGIENVVYPGILRDLREINASYRTLLTETAEIAAARENLTEMRRTWSKMLNPSSTVSYFAHSLRSGVAVRPDTNSETLPPLSNREGPQGSLYLLLIDLNPGLVAKWQGSWQALDGSNPDKLSQAASSYRELIRMVLDELAPNVEVDRSKQGSKRKKQVRQVLRGREADFACTMVEGLPKLYDFLCKPTHTNYQNEFCDPRRPYVW